MPHLFILFELCWRKPPLEQCASFLLSFSLPKLKRKDKDKGKEQSRYNQHGSRRELLSEVHYGQHLRSIKKSPMLRNAQRARVLPAGALCSTEVRGSHGPSVPSVGPPL